MIKVVKSSSLIFSARDAFVKENSKFYLPYLSYHTEEFPHSKLCNELNEALTRMIYDSLNETWWET